MTTPQKVSLYSVNDLKNATDDALSPILTTLPKPYTFKQSHFLTDIRLITGFIAVSLAGGLFYYDHKFGWDLSKPYTLPACAVYFILNGFLTYWIYIVEKGTVFVGVREGGQKLTLKSSSRKHTPTYTLKILYSAPSGKKWEEKEITGKFTEWFNIHGYLDRTALQKWLARNIEVVGMAFDESSSRTKKIKGEDTKITQGNIVATATTTTTSPVQGGSSIHQQVTSTATDLGSNTSRSSSTTTTRTPKTKRKT